MRYGTTEEARALGYDLPTEEEINKIAMEATLAVDAVLRAQGKLSLVLAASIIGQVSGRLMAAMPADQVMTLAQLSLKNIEHTFNALAGKKLAAAAKAMPQFAPRSEHGIPSVVETAHIREELVDAMVGIFEAHDLNKLAAMLVISHAAGMMAVDPDPSVREHQIEYIERNLRIAFDTGCAAVDAGGEVTAPSTDTVQ